MDKDSLVNIKSLKKVYPALRETFAAICIMFNRLPRRVDGGAPGVKIDDYWPEKLSLVNDVQFIKRVQGLDPEKLSKETINKLKNMSGTLRRDETTN
jgi:hypothetical protein